MTDRESRIRALAGVIADARWDGLYMQSSHTLSAQGCLERAARIIDAIDALPVPGEPEFGVGDVCRHCGGWNKHVGECSNDRTGKADR